MKIQVINSQVYQNPYQRLLYSAIGSKYQLASGSLDRAIAQQRLIKRSLYHIHWEESLFARCQTTEQAVRVRREFIERLSLYISCGGKVVWTLHNVKPHEGQFVKTFLTLRKDLGKLAHRILVHNQAALTVLQTQTGLTDLSKVSVIPHPTYLDVYEPAAQSRALAGQPPTRPRTLLYFGLVRAYKGIPDLIRKLPQEFMSRHGLRLHICGRPLRAEAFLNELIAQSEERPEIKYSLDSVPSQEVAGLLRSSAGLILPYHKVLTSGVAVLALTLGVPIVAPNTAAMRELFPASAHHLLFNPNSSNDLRRAVLELVDMPATERTQIAQDYINQGLLFHPQIVSRALGEIYDELLGVNGISGLSSPEHCLIDNTTLRSRVTLRFQLMFEGTMAVRTSKAVATALSNQQIALELTKTILGGNVRSGIPDDLILSSTKDANKLTVERARLDAAYAVRLYSNILSRLEPQLESGSQTNGDAK